MPKGQGMTYATEPLTHFIWEIEDEGITVGELIEMFAYDDNPAAKAAQFLNCLNSISLLSVASDAQPNGPIMFVPEGYARRDDDELLSCVIYDAVHTGNEHNAHWTLEYTHYERSGMGIIHALDLDDRITVAYIERQETQ